MDIKCSQRHHCHSISGWHGHYVIVRTDQGNDDDGYGSLELKELPTRRCLDHGKGVDLGGEDAAWLVPMDYEMPGLNKPTKQPTQICTYILPRTEEDD